MNIMTGPMSSLPEARPERNRPHTDPMPMVVYRKDACILLVPRLEEAKRQIKVVSDLAKSLILSL